MYTFLTYIKVIGNREIESEKLFLSKKCITTNMNDINNKQQYSIYLIRNCLDFLSNISLISVYY